VRIVAEIRGDHVRVEFLAAGEMGREALRSAMPDLKRDLAAAGMQAQLELSSTDRGPNGEAGGSPRDRLGSGGRQTDVRDGVHVPEVEPVSRLIGHVPAGRIDVLA
jgi:flagellar hook-length control protein FliK